MKTAILSFVLLFSFFQASAATAWPESEIMPQGRLHNLLQGRWEYVINTSELPKMNREENAGPEDAETALLRYVFLANGVFVRTITHGNTHVEESGRWETSEDGQFLLLSFAGKEVEKAAIKYIELDEMVLESSFRMPGNAQASDARKLFFNKV